MNTPRVFDSLSLSGAAGTLWLFGAGASKCEPYSVPTQYGLLKHFAAMGPFGRKYGHRQAFVALQSRVQRLVERVVPGREWTSWENCLEEIFSFYELLADDTANCTPAENAAARKALDDLTRALWAATTVGGANTALKFKPFPESRRRTPAPYAELLERLLRGGETRGGAHAFAASQHRLVTMNYDISLDRCLLHLNAQGVFLDYGVPVTGLGSATPPNGAADDATFLLLRLHGSLNWLRCPATTCRTLHHSGEYHADDDNAPCEACGAGPLRPALVYPSYTRRYDDPVIGAIWARTRAELLAADRWIFIGYSLPAADVHLRAVLRSCIEQRRAAGRPTEVLLVGRGPLDLSQKDLELSKAVNEYSALFADRLAVWNATEDGFGDFVGRLCP